MSSRSHTSYDDGELSDSPREKKKDRSARSSSPEDVTSKENWVQDVESEEERLRRRLLARKHEKRHVGQAHSDGEEMFTIQPGGSRHSEKSKEQDKRPKESKDREREKEREKERERPKIDRRDRSDRSDRDKPREKVDRPRIVYDVEKDSRDKQERHRKHEDRKHNHSQHHRVRSEKEKEKEREKDRGVVSKLREKERESERREREKNREEQRSRHDRDNDKDRKRHRRVGSPSSSPEKQPKKREKKISETEKEKKRKRVTSGNSDIVIQSASPNEERMETSDNEEVQNPPLAEGVIELPESEITAFTLDSPAGPKKYSKFDSSPEPEDDHTPVHSPVHYPKYSDEESLDDDEPLTDIGFDAKDAIWEDLTDEQKAMLTPDTKSRMQSEWQKRLVDALPVFYPGVMGCRRVDEFECVNKVEEGTYGVVFRAKDKRTDEIVALKRLKMEKEKEGFPITSLREINMLLKAGHHENIVNVREVLIGTSMDKIYVAMEFVEHDMKSLMDQLKNRGKSFTIGQQKTLMMQLISGLKHMHDLWILHRDLKTSNLLLSHRGVLKIADFGLAREFGSPLKQYTQIVVTLWYRAPELLLGQKLYSTPIDMWSVGCIMAEFIMLKPLFPGKGEIDQINKIFLELGTPSEAIWKGYNDLPLTKQCTFPNHTYNQLRKRLPAAKINETGLNLLKMLLCYDPSKRLTADQALEHDWFNEEPKPTPTDQFPTFPAKSEKHAAPPKKQHQQKQPEIILDAETAKMYKDLKVKPDQVKSGGFALRFDQAKF